MIQISNLLTKIVLIIGFAAVAHLAVGNFLRDVENSLKVLVVVVVVVVVGIIIIIVIISRIFIHERNMNRLNSENSF